MKIIIDECLPKSLTKVFSKHEVWTIPQIGLSGYNDKKLLSELDSRSIDIFITIDGNIEYQQNFINRKFGTIIIKSLSNRLSDLLPLEKELNSAINGMTVGQIIHIPED